MIRAGAILSVFLGVATAFVALPPPTPSIAQDGQIVVAQNNNRPGFFRRLFGGFRDIAPPPAFKSQPLFPGFDSAPKRRARAPAAPTPREVAAVEKAADAKRAMVVGDFMASGLAKGLAEAYRDNPNVVVIDATSGSSGLVRNDFYDWPGKLPGLVADQSPDVILVMIGANDRQTIQTDAGAQALGTDGWRAAYAARVVAFADVLKATGKPVLWAGLVPVSSSLMSRDYSSFNGIMREQLEAKGFPFIDIWNGFADDEGKYVDVGPDVDGQSVQLRASDGLNFTKAGQLKLAYFMQQQLNDILGGNVPQIAAADAAAAAEGGPNAPKIGPMVPLDALDLAGADALSFGDSEQGAEAATISARLSDTSTEPPPAARVDSYVWPPEPAAAAPAPAPDAAAPTPDAAAPAPAASAR
jgi:uncharacterized protein